jgi:hypothetical protein
MIWLLGSLLTVGSVRRILWFWLWAPVGLARFVLP